MIDEKLKQWATEIDKKYIDGINRLGSAEALARELGKSAGTIRGAMAALRKRAAMAGYSPEHDMTRTAPAPFVVKGVSTYYDKEGEVRGQWVKTSLDREAQREALEEWVKWLVEDARGMSVPVSEPEAPYLDDDLLTFVPIGDPHFGMLSWGKETGENFDLRIAEDDMKRAAIKVFELSQPSRVAIINNLGDMFHADNNTAVTPGHGNRLDVDSRHQRAMKIGLRAQIFFIEEAKKHHAKVIYVINPGNHDPNAAWMLALALDAFYSNDPRVEVVTSPNPFWYYEHGKILLGTTHGDGIKAASLPGIMAADQAQAWGRTEHRYWHTGHIHHHESNEFPGVVWEAHRTLAPRDAWHHKSGYRAGRDIKVITYHKELGEVVRSTINIKMLRSA